MGDYQFLLLGKDFAVNAPNTFKQLWTDKDFTDVTLVTEDDQQIKAHKVILSSCSQFFRNLLVKNPHENPLIYLKGIRHNKLEMVLKFIYLGECHVANEDFQDFLATGVDLMVNGLMESLDQENLDHQDGIKLNEIVSTPEPLYKSNEELQDLAPGIDLMVNGLKVNIDQENLDTQDCIKKKLQHQNHCIQLILHINNQKIEIQSVQLLTQVLIQPSCVCNTI